MRDPAIITGSALTGAAMAAVGHYDFPLLYAVMFGLTLPVMGFMTALCFGIEEPPFPTLILIPLTALVSFVPITVDLLGLASGHEIAWYLGLAYAGIWIALLAVLLATGLALAIADVIGEAIQKRVLSGRVVDRLTAALTAEQLAACMADARRSVPDVDELLPDREVLRAYVRRVGPWALRASATRAQREHSTQCPPTHATTTHTCG